MTGPAGGAPGPAPRVVLVVDDEPIIRYLITHVLVRAGCEVLPAEHGGQALEALAGRPDVQLVVSDLAMPEVDGFELLRQVRARGGPPVVILTSRGQESDEQLARSLGAADVLTKPFSRHDLLRLLSGHLGD